MDENGIMLKKSREGKTLIHHNGFTYKMKYEGSKKQYIDPSYTSISFFVIYIIEESYIRKIVFKI